MTALAIRLDGLGKEYRIGERRRRYRTLGEMLSSEARRLATRWRRGGGAPSADRIWALRDVALEVARGEAVGLIGGNGAGKSTLLKILSRITEPTIGYAAVRGRVGSLLEVGTGFHAELTGRENIFLNGAILGMRRREIERKFDEIVDFAGVERFIDTPVKHYSSGMYLRLAFAVAAHLEPEVLLVDEVLAVGDAEFQRRCLGKMEDVTRTGRTVIFVSHNMEAIQRLCPRSVLLARGQVAMEGESAVVIARHLAASGERPAPGAWVDLAGVRHSGTGEVRFTAARYAGVSSAGGHAATETPLEIEVAVHAQGTQVLRSLAVGVRTMRGVSLLSADVLSIGQTIRLESGRSVVRFRLRDVHLNPGMYIVALWAGHPYGGAIDWIEEAFEIEIMPHPAAVDVGQTPKGLVTCGFDVSVEGPA